MGGGGTGKSSLALEYVRQNIKAYSRHIAWFQAENLQETLNLTNLERQFRAFASQIFKIAHALNIDKLNWPKLLEKIVNKLSKLDKCLLIFDNVENIDHIDPIIKSCKIFKNIHIIITTRNREKWPIPYRLPILVFSPSESLSYLNNRLSASVFPTSELSSLAASVGHLPLALKQASSYICKHHKDIEDYIMALKNITEPQDMELFEADNEGSLSVYKTVMISVKKLRKNPRVGQQAWRILCILSYFPSELIPIKELTISVSSSIDLKKVFSCLTESYSLLDIANPELGYYKMHRLTQLIVRMQDKSRDYLIEAINFIQGKFINNRNHFSYSAKMLCILECAETLVEHITHYNFQNINALNFISDVANFYIYSLRNFGQAINLLNIINKISDIEYSNFRIFITYATALVQSGSLPQKSRAMVKKVDDFIKELGENKFSPSEKRFISDAFETYGNLHYKEGDFNLAIKLYNRALSCVGDSAEHSTNSIRVNLLHNIACAQFFLGDFANSISSLKEIKNKYLSDDDNSMINYNSFLGGMILHSLGRINLDYKDLIKAEKYLTQALEIHKNIHGDKFHQDIGYTLIALADYNIEQGRCPIAEELLGQALEHLPPKHEHSAYYNFTCAKLYIRNKKSRSLIKAQECIRKSIKVYGIFHNRYEVILARRLEGDLRAREGNYLAAKDIYLQIIKEQLCSYPTHYQIGVSYSLLANCYFATKDYLEAAEYYSKSLKYLINSFSCHHDIYLEIMEKLNKTILLIPKNRNGNTLLHWCAKLGAHQLISRFARPDINMNVKNREGLYPLHLAAQEHHTPIVLTLIENGAIVDSIDKEGNLPLHYALITTNDENIEEAINTVSILLEAGANYNKKNFNDHTCVDVLKTIELASHFETLFNSYVWAKNETGMTRTSELTSENSEIPQRTIYIERWLLHLARKPRTVEKTGYPEHAFLIIEGIENNKHFVWYADLVAHDGGRAPRINSEKIHSKGQNSEKLLPRCAYNNLKDIKLLAKTWDIDKVSAIKLIQSVDQEKEKVNKREIPFRYNILGIDNSSARYSNKQGHNCFTWARDKINQMQHPYIKMKKSWLDPALGGWTSYHIPDSNRTLFPFFTDSVSKIALASSLVPLTAFVLYMFVDEETFAPFLQP